MVQRAGRFYALHDRCPHRGAPFSELGMIDESGNLLCGWHYWAFRLADGGHTEVEGVAVCTFPVRVTADRLEIDIARPPR